MPQHPRSAHRSQLPTEHPIREALAEGLLDWPLDGDPAIRCQTRRDLLDATPQDVAAERACRDDGLGAAASVSPEPAGHLGRRSLPPPRHLPPTRNRRTSWVAPAVVPTAVALRRAPRSRSLPRVRLARDHRFDDALGALQKRRRTGGAWPVQTNHAGRVGFDIDDTGGPSRWNTLRALRSGRWAHQADESE